MEAHDRILNKASELFVRYGIRSITMDEIALQLGISKKTIYQFYADKNELVEAVIVQMLEFNQQCCNKDRAVAANAVHEVFLAMEMVQEMFENMNPSVLYDLEKYHPKAFERFIEYKYKFLHKVIRENLERGIQEELYREDLNIAVMTALRLETLMVPFTLNINAKLKATLTELQQQVIEHFLFGIASMKGYKLILNIKPKEPKKYLMMGKQRFINTCLILLATVLSIRVSAQQTHAFSAKQSVDFALKNNVQIKNALINIEIQQQSNREITAAAYPQVDGSLGVTNYLSLPTQLLPGEFFGQPAGTYIPVRFGTKYNSTYGVNLRQILFDGQVFIGLKARKSAIVYSEQTVAVAQEQIKSNVYKVYYQLVVGRNQIRVIDANIAMAEKLLHDTKELFKNGFQEQLDVDKVNVSISNLKTQKTMVENQLQTGNLALKYLMGLPVKDQLALTDTLDDRDIKSGIASDGSFRYEDRVEFQLQQTAAKLQAYNVKRYQVAYYPTLSLNGGYSSNAQRNKFNFLKSGEPWFATSFFSVNLAVPIFDGFAKDARIKQAKLQLRQTENLIADLRNSIDNDVQTARVEIANAITTMDEQKKNMALAQQVYNQTKLKYEQGLGSNLEITNAETDMVTAQNNYFSAVYDAIIARIDYLKAIGKL